MNTAAFTLAVVATDAMYWHAALLLDVHDIDAAKEWAFDIVAREATPDIRIIEVATARTREEGVAALAPLTAGANVQEVATRLFQQVRARLHDNTLAVEDAIALSLRICALLALPFATRHAFDRVDSMLKGSAQDLEHNRPAIRSILLVTLETPFQP